MNEHDFGQSSFFNFYYCRLKKLIKSNIGCQSSFFNFYYCRFILRFVCFGVNPLSLISTIVDKGKNKSFRGSVNPLSLISTIVDDFIHEMREICQSSFFNFYYCRSYRLKGKICGQSSFFNFYYCR